jgi:hypothetical protein
VETETFLLSTFKTETKIRVEETVRQSKRAEYTTLTLLFDLSHSPILPIPILSTLKNEQKTNLAIYQTQTQTPPMGGAQAQIIFTIELDPSTRPLLAIYPASCIESINYSPSSQLPIQGFDSLPRLTL